jgi:beta-alanine degradation protein BauB
MRATRLIAGALLGGLLLGAAGLAAAGQDPVKVGPTIYTKAFENEKVRVSSIKFKPGDSIPMHTHPEHFLYILTPGTLTITRADGSKSDLQAKAGEVVWSGPDSHSAVNSGTSEVTAIVVEFKPLPEYDP